MSSSRPKLTLDEQSFEGLLAAAFTIQQHNDRRQALRSNSNLNKEPEKRVEPAALCEQCGSSIPTGKVACPKCGAENFRPGERLQRTWASMWMISQEKLLGAETDPKNGDGSESYRDYSGGNEGGHVEPHPAPFSGQDQIALQHSGDPAPSLHPLDKKFGDTARVLGLDESRGNPTNPFSIEPSPNGDTPFHLRITEDDAADDIVGQSLAPVHAEGISTDHDLPGSDSVVPVVPNMSAIGRRLLDLKVKLRFHRADFYLGVALVVAFLALLWPATASQRPALRPWEKVLVAMGIAEAPEPAVQYSGNPNTKVWVDTHTALYYCPGDELYGKSQDGHYSTQHDAQLDRFEPAERIACE